ncbi:MAG: hypothetical protein ACRD2X_03425, partial [Vicinamibacteraceae bacterium]
SSSTDRHTFFLEQDGRWLRGSHQTALSARELTGTIEGTRIALQSPVPRPAATFVFWGDVSGDRMTGSIDMGEYLTASFTACRNASAGQRAPIRIPSDLCRADTDAGRL